MDGLSPIQGWTGEHDWRGFIPFDGINLIIPWLSELILAFLIRTSLGVKP